MRKYFVLLTGAALAAQAMLSGHGMADEAGETAARRRIAKSFTHANAETCFRRLIDQERAAYLAATRAINAQLVHAERLAGDRLAGKALPLDPPPIPPATITLPNGLVVEKDEGKDIRSFADPVTGTWCSGSPYSNGYTFGVVSKLADGHVRTPLFYIDGKAREIEIKYPGADSPVDIIVAKDQIFDATLASENGVFQPYREKDFSQKDRAFISGWFDLGKRLLTIQPFTDPPVKPAGKPTPKPNPLAASR